MHKKRVFLKMASVGFPNEKGKLCGDVWHITSERHKSKINGKTMPMGHATPKPLEMIERIIKASSREGDIVFDCFVGSGTTAIAAKKLNRNFLCADNSKEFVALANKRLSAINGEIPVREENTNVKPLKVQQVILFSDGSVKEEVIELYE